MARRKIKIGLVDADLLCNGTRHPNLALLKIAGYFRDNGYVRGYTDGASCYELITNESRSMITSMFLVSLPLPSMSLRLC